MCSWELVGGNLSQGTPWGLTAASVPPGQASAAAATAELLKKQEELNRKAEELDRRERELQQAALGGAASAWIFGRCWVASLGTTVKKKKWQSLDC